MSDVQAVSVARTEIQRGLVLHLQPEILGASQTTTCSVSAELAVQGGHFFVCLSVADSGRSRWLPVYSDNRNSDRVEIPQESRFGYYKWTKGPCFYHPAQIWEADYAVVDAAARGDRSRNGSRNSVFEGDDFALPEKTA